MAAVEAMQEASAAESLLRCLRYFFFRTHGLCLTLGIDLLLSVTFLIGVVVYDLTTG
jgi:hypothetical protein